MRAVSSWLFGHDCKIADSDQFRDIASDTFSMRVHLAEEHQLESLKSSFKKFANENTMA